MASKPNNDSNGDAGNSGKGKSGKSLLIGFISVIVVVETALFFFLVPSAEEVAALAEARLVSSLQENEEEAERTENDDNVHKEFDLGTFGETFRPNGCENNYRIEMRLYAVVRAKDFQLLEKEFKEKSGRIRHEIRKGIRNTTLEELEENQLGLLQRKIFGICNHLVANGILVQIGFSEYQLFQE